MHVIIDPVWKAVNWKMTRVERLLIGNLNDLTDKNKIKNLVLSLEQILMLKINPELNVLKVAGSPAGLKRSPESMFPSLLKTSKSVYLYDDVAKELIYISPSRSDLGRVIDCDPSSIVKSIQNNTLYLNRFKFSDSPIDSEVYSVNMRTKEALLTFINAAPSGGWA